MHRALPFVVAIAVGSAASTVATPCFAIDTDTPSGPPVLPPPPPPPLTSAPPGASSSSSSTARPRPATSAPPASPTATGTSTDTAPSGLHALDTRWFVNAMIGYLSENYSVGIGIRGGKTLDNHLYLGATVVDQIGNGYNSAYFGPEGGYDFDLGVVVIRPYLGAGLLAYHSGAQFVIWPGGSVLWNIPGSIFFIGGDLRLVSAPGTPIGAYFLAGVHFGI